MDDVRALRRLLRVAAQFLSGGRGHITADRLNEIRTAAGMKPRKLDEEGARKVLARLREATLPETQESAIAKSTDMSDLRVHRACCLLVQRGQVESADEPGRAAMIGRHKWRLAPKERP